MSSSFCQHGESDASWSSGWVEDFLIEFYLEGSSGAHYADGDTELRAEPEEKLYLNGNLSEKVYGTDKETSMEPTVVVEDICKPQHQQVEAAQEDEKLLEAWQAQYGQVVRSDGEADVCPRAISLWNWSTIVSTGKYKLLGRVANTLSRLHHSLQNHNGIIKTSHVCEVNLDLVKVTSGAFVVLSSYEIVFYNIESHNDVWVWAGEIYRLRQPSLKYLKSVATYDSSNPTKGWNFPCITLSGLEETTEHSPSKLSTNSSVVKPFIPNQNHQRYQQLKEKKVLLSPAMPAGLRALSGGEMALAKERKRKYRDRAKERWERYGDSEEECKHGMHQGLTSLAKDMDNASEEKLKRPLIGRHMLEQMGWCEGERIGKREDGLIRPLDATGNRGRAGIGWFTPDKDLRG